MKRLLILPLIVFLSGQMLVRAQGIKGTIQDEDGQSIPYASIFIKELTRGTTTNALGEFSLPLPSGSYHIFFRSLGYSEVKKRVTLDDKMVELGITLPPQTYMIPEVRVIASGEDPAYGIMRKVIGLAHYHLNQVKTYEAEIYMKGTALFDRLPRAIAKRIEVNDIRVKEDKAYMLESLNEVTYQAPDNYDMKIVASQNTIPGYSEAVNPMDYVNASLYQEEIEGFVSPLARSAFFYYNFSFEGSYIQGTHMIDKIKVTPKRKSQQLCEGYIYIVEDLWCLHSSDLKINTIAGTLNLEQLYANVIMDAWLPVSHKIDMNVEIAGVRANVTYVSSLEYEKVELNPNLPKSYFASTSQKQGSEPEKREPSKEQQRIQEILEKEELNNRDMAKLNKLMEKEVEASEDDQESLQVKTTNFTVERNAVNTDSAYWDRVRPVPLTPAEMGTLQERDSILELRSGPKGDSVRRRGRRNRPFRNILRGHTYRNKNRKLRFRHEGLLDLEQAGFNTVDGWHYAQQFRMHYKIDPSHTFRSHLVAGYAFNRKAPLITWNSNVLYGPLRRAKVSLNMDYTSFDFNRHTGIPSLTNSVYSLFFRENYTKRYENINATLENRIDIVNGLTLYTRAVGEIRNQLQNTNEFSFFFRDQKDFTDNFPADNQNSPIYDDSKLFAAQVWIEYTPEYTYRLVEGRKHMVSSEWPTFSINYRHAIPLQSTGWASYSHLKGSVYHEMEAGLLSTFTYQLEGGFFPLNESMHFSDLAHFKSAPLLADMNGFTDAYMLLDFYSAATSDWYVSAHTELNSSFLLLKLLPWVSERFWTESLMVKYLKTPSVNHHMELGYSLNEILFLLDIGFFAGFEDWKYQGTGLRLNFRF